MAETEGCVLRSSYRRHPTTRRSLWVGDFNGGWDPTETPLRVAGDACTATITLPAGGRHAFRYVRPNGEFFNDDAAHGYQPNAFGGYDFVIDLTGEQR